MGFALTFIFLSSDNDIFKIQYFRLCIDFNAAVRMRRQA